MKQARFSPNGTLLAAGFDNVVNIVDVTTDLKHISTLSGHEKNVSYVCWNATGDYLMTVSEDAVHLWDPNKRQLIQKFTRSHEKFFSCLFHPTDPTKALIGRYQSLCVWEWSIDRPTATPPIAVHSGIVSSISYSEGCGLLATASHDTTVKLWSI